MHAIVAVLLLGWAAPQAPAPVLHAGTASPSATDPSSPGTSSVEISEATPRPSPATSAVEPSRSAFSIKVANKLDPYGPRPEGVPRLSLDQLVTFALDNPAVEAANEEVQAMRAQLRKARFAWIPTIDTEATLMPGVKVLCEDVSLVQESAVENFDFQWCHPARANDDVSNVQEYFRQIGQAGVRVEFRADMLIPITTFGKLLHTKRATAAAVALKELARLQAEQETVLRVYQAHAALLLARESKVILAEAKRIVDAALARIEADLGAEDAWDEDDGGEDAARNPDDRYRAKLSALELERLMREALKIEAVSLSALWALAGKAAPPGFDIAEREQIVHRTSGPLEGVQHYRELAFRHRPEARMATAAVQAREHQERLARANFLPDLGIALRFAVARANAADTAMQQLYYLDNFNYSRFTAALALRWRWDFHFKTFDLASARANVRAADAQRRAAELLLGQDVEQAYRDVTEARERIAIEREAVDLAWKLVVSGQQKDMVGGGNATELLRSLEQWYRRRFELARAIQTHNEALARLSRAVGTTLIGS